MKKLFLGIAAFSLLLGVSSCANETREVAEKDGKVGFKTALGKQTRVGEFGNASWVAGDDLNVYAYTTIATPKVNTFALEYDGTIFDYSPPFYQPGYALRYYSVYPETSVTGASIANSTTVNSFTFNYAVQTVATQQDLIAATETSDLEAVTLPFKHILSQVNFAVVDVLGMQIDIKNLSVNNVKDSGTYTLTMPATSSDWSNRAASGADYTYLNTGGLVSEFSVPGTTGNIVYMGNGNGTYTNTNALMLLPQTFLAEADGTISFDFNIETEDENGDPQYYPGPTDNTTFTSTTINLCDFDVTTWAQGKRYVYVIDFTNYLSKGKITFTVVVADWEDSDEGDIATTVLVAMTGGAVEAAIDQHGDANVANPALGVFPISVPLAISAAVNVTAIADKYDEDDQIRVEFVDAASAAFFNISAGVQTYWDLTVNDRVVTLTRNSTPMP